MRIRIISSAYRHGITDTEIRTVVEYPAVRVALTARRPGTNPVLFIGAPADNEPDLEIIADVLDPAEIIVFHAMMLRRSIVASLGLSEFIEPNYSSQRP